MEYKLNLGDPKAGKTFKKDVSGVEAKVFFGRKIGDKIDGSKIGLEGYEFEIRGGSDYCGFPMRPDVAGGVRRQVLVTRGVGNRDNWGGRRRRRTVVGNMVSDKITQINLKILKYGKTPLAGEAKEGEVQEGAKKGGVKVEEAPKEGKAKEGVKAQGAVSSKKEEAEVKEQKGSPEKKEQAEEAKK